MTDIASTVARSLQEARTKQQQAAKDATQSMNFKRAMGDRIIEAYLDLSATMGKGSIAWWYSRILQEARIGEYVSIGGGCEIGRGCKIGDYTRIGANTFLPPNSVVGHHVFIGPCVTFTDDMHPRVPLPGEPPYDAQPPIIEDHAAIGAGAVILPGVRIGEGARIAAGAIVTRDVPAMVMVKSQPGRFSVPPDAWTHRVEHDLSHQSA